MFLFKEKCVPSKTFDPGYSSDYYVYKSRIPIFLRIYRPDLRAIFFHVSCEFISVTYTSGKRPTINS